MNQIIVDVDEDEDDDQGVNGDCEWGQPAMVMVKMVVMVLVDDQTSISACLCFNATLTISCNTMVDPAENSKNGPFYILSYCLRQK